MKYFSILILLSFLSNPQISQPIQMHQVYDNENELLCLIQSWEWTTIDSLEYKAGFRLIINNFNGTWTLEQWEIDGSDPKSYWVFDSGSGLPPVTSPYVPPHDAIFACLESDL